MIEREVDPNVTDWGKHGTCATWPDPDLWFSDKPAEIREAVGVCGGCPVRNLCAAQGAAEPHGVWGGVPDKSQAARVNMRGRDVKVPGAHEYNTAQIRERRRLVLSMLRRGYTVRDVSAVTGYSADVISRNADVWRKELAA